MKSVKQFVNRIIFTLVPMEYQNDIIYYLYNLLNRKDKINIDSSIKLLRNTKHNDLKKVEEVENIICESGLSNSEIFNYPEHLISYCGFGLKSWQYPNQLSKYLIELTKYKINSYLEIGVQQGGTFILTIEYLTKFNKIDKAIGVDINPSKPLKIYKKYNKQFKIFIVNTREKNFENILKKINNVDLVLIDGDHSEEGCWRDFVKVKDKANLIAFHDIVGSGVPGVSKVWSRIKDDFGDDYIFKEFTEQYDEVLEKTGQTWLGLGLAIRKSYLKGIQWT